MYDAKNGNEISGQLPSPRHRYFVSHGGRQPNIIRGKSLPNTVTVCSKIHVVLQYGRLQSYHAAYGYWHTPQRFMLSSRHAAIRSHDYVPYLDSFVRPTQPLLARKLKWHIYTGMLERHDTFTNSNSKFSHSQPGGLLTLICDTKTLLVRFRCQTSGGDLTETDTDTRQLTLESIYVCSFLLQVVDCQQNLATNKSNQGYNPTCTRTRILRITHGCMHFRLLRAYKEGPVPYCTTLVRVG